MTIEKKKPALAVYIVGALVLGIIVGLFMTDVPEIADEYIAPFGTIFLNLIQFIVIPIVFFSIISGIISMKDIRKVGTIGIKTIIYFFMTTAVALVIALIISNLFKGSFAVLETTGLEYTESSEPVSFMDTLVNMFPSNIIQPFSEAIMLQVIFASVIFGYGILVVGEKGKPFRDFVESITVISIAIMDLILKISPIGVFCLITPVVATHGASILGSLGMVLLCAYVCYIVHSLLVYSITVKAFANISPITFFKKMAATMMFAFSSSSSVGTLPLNMDSCEALGARKDITSFVLPLGATINMNGTAIYQAVCAVFIASCYGIELTIAQMISIVITATLSSVGTAGVPGAGVVMLAMVLQSVGLPVEGIALVMGVDRIFDMGRTTVNITGDAACAVIVSAMEDKKEAKKKKLVEKNN